MDDAGTLGMSLRENLMIAGRRMGKSATMSDLMDQEVARIRADYDRAVSTSTLDFFHNTGTFNHAEISRLYEHVKPLDPKPKNQTKFSSGKDEWAARKAQRDSKPVVGRSKSKRKKRK
jgi:hypothetical protein